MRWVKLVLALVLVVGWTSAALAECAWVLWQGAGEAALGTYTTKALWNIEGASDNLKGCEKLKIEAWKRVLANIEAGKGWAKIMDTDFDIEKIPHDRLALIVKGKSELEKYVELRFLCLPETVDPRSKEQNL